MSSRRACALLMIPLFTGCFGYASEPPPIQYSPGFFASFDQMVEETKSRGSAATQAQTFRNEFTRWAQQGPSVDELYAVGPAWDKVGAFLDIGLLSAETMTGIEGVETSRVDIYGVAADRVLRSDYVAMTSWNREVTDMGFANAVIPPTAEMIWESLYLVLSASEHAQRQVSVEKGSAVEGHWVRGPASQKNLWVDGYSETIWEDGQCREEYLGSDCSTIWVDEYCSDVYIEDGYWESTCSAYDEDGNCVEITDEWVDTSYYETQCFPGYWEEQCTDVYQTVCDPGRWVDVWIAAHEVRGARIPGELQWVEGYSADASKQVTMALPEYEAAMLATGIEYVLAYGPGRVKDDCAKALQNALTTSAVALPEKSVQASRNAILYCLSKR